ncbi:hypothetical protein BEP19_04710 [Ammoniphilus oxalaticus]|uniref:Uncharacterized protein n=1 Tax=Ammoniphilus oxalaticus TaxID=66863 RepID=A0A419SM12_9BACL|nr:hypothetical protein [Ammoniphilus oxalaticus]RKD25123.1 hypothetical protein BEP19_04710 [Ammoniphilus oxalaticus]
MKGKIVLIFLDEELHLIEKFGFRLEGSVFVHAKMGIERDAESFKGFSSLAQLEDYVKTVLRSI